MVTSGAWTCHQVTMLCRLLGAEQHGLHVLHSGLPSDDQARLPGDPDVHDVHDRWTGILLLDSGGQRHPPSLDEFNIRLKLGMVLCT